MNKLLFFLPVGLLCGVGTGIGVWFGGGGKSISESDSSKTSSISSSLGSHQEYEPEDKCSGRAGMWWVDGQLYTCRTRQPTT